LIHFGIDFDIISIDNVPIKYYILKGLKSSWLNYKS
jgi:hypothetical protein